jgi:cytochrome c biogenesis protein CcmG, thiol:disulfide interchange protein DsbE
MKRLRFLIPLGVFGLLVIVLAIGIARSPDKGTIVSPLLGKPAPEFSLPNLLDASQTVKSSDLHGRWYVFNVWGTWCFACREEHNTLLEIKHQAVVPLIGMDWKDGENDPLGYLQQSGNPYDVIAADKDGRAAIDWGVYGAPETFLVNDKGIVVYKYVGAMTRQVWEKEFLSRLPPRQGQERPDPESKS